MHSVRRCLSATLLLYAALMAVTSLLAGLPAPMGAASAAWLGAWGPPVSWVGVHGFRFDLADLAPQSGDSAFSYVLALCFLIVAFAGGFLWSALDRSDRTRASRAAGLDMALRAWLAAALFAYGFAKVFPSQFPPLDAGTLVTRVGDLSPSRLYWTAMGHAPSYAVFAGLLEAAAGILLLFRRTVTLGALLAAGLMANVAVVNYAYAVGVFFLSLQLLGAASLLILLDGRRLWAFAAGKAAPELSENSAPKAMRWGFGLVMALALCGSAFDGWRAWRTQAAHRAAPLAGAYELESLSVDGHDRPLLMTDASCWRRVWVADLAPVLFIYTMDGPAHGFRMKLDPVAGRMVLDGPSIKGPSTLHYSTPDADHLVLEGRLGAQDISARLKKVDTERMPLSSETFHWIPD